MGRNSISEFFNVPIHLKQAISSSLNDPLSIFIAIQLEKAKLFSLLWLTPIFFFHLFSFISSPLSSQYNLGPKLCHYGIIISFNFWLAITNHWTHCKHQQLWQQHLLICIKNLKITKIFFRCCSGKSYVGPFTVILSETKLVTLYLDNSL